MVKNQNGKKTIVLAVLVLFMISIFASFPIVSNADVKYPAYFEVSKPQKGKNYAVFHDDKYGTSPSHKIDLGTLIYVDKKEKNTKGNYWYRFKYGSYYKWIFEEYVDYRGSITEISETMETINKGKYWTKPWSDETSKYTSYSHFGDGKVIKVSRKINRNGTIWYKVYNENKFIYEGNVKKHSCTKDIISKSNYKAISSSQHSFDYTYRLCNNSTCPNYSKTKTNSTTVNHSFDKGVCKCKYWKAHKPKDLGSVKYVVTTDNAKVHKGPYGKCDDITTLHKGTIIYVTQSIENYEDHTWYRYTGGYIYSAYVKKHESCEASKDKGVDIKYATCTETGTKYYTCTLCGATWYRVIDALGHDYQKGVCSRCKAWKIKSKTNLKNVKYVVTTDNASVHNGPYKKCDVIATLSKGTTFNATQSIENCEEHTWYKYNGGYIYSKYVEKHIKCTSWKDGPGGTPATCTKNGTKVQYCTLCGATQTGEVKALGHDYQKGVCSRCKVWKVKSKTSLSNVKYVVTTDNAKVHNGPYGKCGVVTTLPKKKIITVTQSVKNYEDHTWYKYSGGFIYSKYVEKHTKCTSWKDGPGGTPATCTKNGTKVQYCTLCGATQTVEVKALGHNYKKGVCTRCSAWQKSSLKSTSSLSNVKYVVTKNDGAIVHKGPYGACKTVCTLSKGTIITVTEKMVNAQNNTWYKCKEGYIYSAYVRKYSTAVLPDTSGLKTAKMYHSYKNQNGSSYITKEIENVPIKFNSDWFFNDSKTYNQSISRMCSQLLVEGYQPSRTPIKKTLNELGFELEYDTLYVNYNTGRDEMNYFITSKTIVKDNKPFNLVIVGCIGSHKLQWNSNFDPAGLESGKSQYNPNSTVHVGFNDAKNYIDGKLKNYINAKGFDKENTKLLITGHSRGAATANLLAADYINADYNNNGRFAYSKNIFTYTFATPNNAKVDVEKTNDAKYDRIFNIVLPTDFVTHVMLKSWGYGKFGMTYSLPSLQNDSEYSTYKNKMLAKYKVLNMAIDGNTVFNDYPKGEKEVNDVINTMYNNVKSINDYYHKPIKFGILGLDKYPYDFFQEVLCPFVNKQGEEALAIDMAANAVMGSDGLYKTVTMFFIKQEKLSGRFTDAHKMTTYCSYMLALSKDDVIKPR